MNPEDFAQYDALIFDMDGTLIDSGQLHEVAWAKTLSAFDIPMDRKYMRSLAGVPTFETVALLIKKFDAAVSASVHAISEYKSQAIQDLMFDYVKPTTLAALVHHYHGRKPMAVGTGAQTSEAHDILSHCKLRTQMAAIVGADQAAKSKPAPDTFLLCAELLGVAPNRCVVFEDSPLGLQAATDAGMTAIDVADLNIYNDYFL